MINKVTVDAPLEWTDSISSRFFNHIIFNICSFERNIKKTFGGLIAFLNSTRRFRVGVPVNYILASIGAKIMMMTIADLFNKGLWIVVIQSGE